MTSPPQGPQWPEGQPPQGGAQPSYGQSGYGPQPSYGQPTPWQQPGYLQQQAPYGQQQAPYGQQRGVGQFPGGPPKRKKTGLILGLSGGGVVVVAGIVLLLVFTLGGSGPGKVVDKAIEAANKNDYHMLQSVTCPGKFGKKTPEELERRANRTKLHQKLWRNGELQQHGDTASAKVKMRETRVEFGQTKKQTAEGTFQLKKRDQTGWCLDEVEPGRSSSPGSAG